MVELAHPARNPGLAPEYLSFLYATINADANGTTLSVLSAMARMNLDPWQETAYLAALPATAATHRLASLIAAVPGGPSQSDASGTIAARLVKLLPGRSRRAPPSWAPSTFAARYLEALKKPRTALYLLIVLIALTAANMWVAVQKPPSVPPTAASGMTAPRDTPPVPGRSE